MDYSPWDSPGQNTGVGSRSLLQGIFPTQGSNPGLPHCRQILYQLSYKGSLLWGEVERKCFSRGRCIFPSMREKGENPIYILRKEGSPCDVGVLLRSVGVGCLSLFLKGHWLFLGRGNLSVWEGHVTSGRALEWKLVFRCKKHSFSAFISEEQVCVRQELPLTGETGPKPALKTCG